MIYIFKSFLFFILSYSLLANEVTFRAPVWNNEIQTGALQAKIDKLAPNTLFELNEGQFEGPIRIRTPGIVIDGKNVATINGRNQGSVIIIEADDVIVKNLTIIGSGRKYEQADAGISIRSSHNITIEGNDISDSLFGIDVHSGRDIKIISNKIRSLNLEVGLRGDAIRLWSTKRALVRGNQWRNARDSVAWYCSDITFEDNVGSYSRYSLHSMYSQNLKIRNNIFDKNSVGIFLMYGTDIVVYNNTVSYSQGATGMGIGLKETSNISIIKNKFHYCAIGMLIDSSPFNRGSKNWINNNTIAYNGKGVVLNNDSSGNSISRNIFLGNMIDVDTENRRGSLSEWKENYWYKYLGFDMNKDGKGDAPHIIKKYGDRLKNKSIDTSFFYATPLFSLVEYIEEVLYLGKPMVVLKDASPLLIN